MTASATGSMPSLRRPRYASLLAGLGVLGVAQGVIGWLLAVQTARLLAGEPGASLAHVVWLVVGTAVVFGGSRLVSEWLAQTYVHDLRLKLLTAEFTDRAAHPGIVMVRSSSDLLAVKQWIGYGLGPLVSGVSTVLALLLASAVVEPIVSFALLISAVSLLACLTPLARRLRRQARHVRRLRGRLSMKVADDLAAWDTVVCAGRPDRELRQLSKRSAAVRRAGMARAVTTSLMRAAAVLQAGIFVPLVLWLSGPDVAALALAAVLSGLLAPISLDLTRAAEYRQGYLAAVAVYSRRLGRSAAAVSLAGTELAVGGLTPSGVVLGTEGVHLGHPGLAPGLCLALPRLRVRDGERVLITLPAMSGDVVEWAVPQLVRLLTGVQAPDVGLVTSPGRGPRGRDVVGLWPGMTLEPASLQRSVTMLNGVPAAAERQQAAFRRVGLDDVLARLPAGDRTRTKPHRAGPLDQYADEVLACRVALNPPKVLVLGMAGEGFPPAVLRELLGSARTVILVAAAQHQADLAALLDVEPRPVKRCG